MSQYKVKIQLGDKIKMMNAVKGADCSQLNESAKKSFPARLANKQIKLKYQDEEGEWLSISDDQDAVAFEQFAIQNTDKKAKLVIDVTGTQQEQAKIAEKEIIEGVQNMEIGQQEQEEEQKVKFEDLKDFKILDALTEVEALLNSEEKFGPFKLFATIMQAAKGTKAEFHLRRIMKKFRKGGCRGEKRDRSHSDRKCWKKGKCRRGESSSPDKDSFPPFFGPFGPQHFGGPSHFGFEAPEHFGYGGPGHFGPFGHCGPRGHGPWGHGKRMGKGPHCHGPRGHHGKGKKAMKLFRKFMEACKDESSSSSSEEVEKAVITNLPKEVPAEQVD